MADRSMMMKEIAETSFLLDDLRLYLDTHPLDENALNIYAEYNLKRKTLLKEYAGLFEPLTCDCVCLESNSGADTQTKHAVQKHWTWNDGPIPWDTEAGSPMKGGR